jgi:hypothetical protein
MSFPDLIGESINFNMFLMTDQVRYDSMGPFYETVKFIIKVPDIPIKKNSSDKTSK